jgi:DNA-binding transcriptional MocR family regulator
MGLIHAEGRRGTIVGKPVSGKTSLSDLIDSVPSSGDESSALPFGTEAADLSSTLKRIARRPDLSGFMQYERQSDLRSYVEAGVKWLAKLDANVSPDSVVLTWGAHHGLMLALATAAQHGDTIAAESHTYPGLMSIAAFLGLRLVGVGMDRQGLIPEALDAVCKRGGVRALVCMPTVQNPTNATLSEVRRKEIITIAERHDVAIIEDDVFRPLVPDPPPLMKPLAPDRCDLVTSVSKILAPGLRVGFVVPPSRSHARLADLLMASTLLVSPMPIEILTDWLKDGTADRIIRKGRREAESRQKLVTQILPTKWVHSKPTSYFVWIELPEPWDASEFANEALRQGVSVWPAHLFAVDPGQSGRAVRFVIGAKNRVILKESLEILAALLQTTPRHRVTAY